MLFCHLGRAQSLREICGGLAASEGKLRHLGLPDAPKRSTLAYANEHRPWSLYRSVFYQLLGRCREVAGSHGFRFKNKLLTLDATLIELCASVFDWAQYRRTKGAVKLHLLLDHQGLLPSFALITEGRVHESRVARSLRFEPGTIVVFDRGYADYDWFASLDAEGVFFVTRMKDNADYGVVERRAVPEHGAVRRDEIIFLYKAARTGNDDLFLRRIEVWDEEHQCRVVFLTNHRGFAASTIAAIYRQRWQIELFFKALKQNLRVRTFVGPLSTGISDLDLTLSARHSGLLMLNRTFRLRSFVSRATSRKCSSIRIRFSLISSVRSLRSSLSLSCVSRPSLSPRRLKPDSSPQAGHFERAISPIFCPSTDSIGILDIGAPHLQ